MPRWGYCQVQYTGTVVESQPDWLTAAAHDAQHGERLHVLARAWLAAEQRSGERVRPWRLMGYSGQQAGRVRYGLRDTACLVQLSGDLAAQHLRTVRGIQQSLTRLDLATTVCLPTYDSFEAERAYGAAVAYRAAHPQLARPRLVMDGDGGSTLYIGERTSDYMLRLYNKQAERESAADPAGASQYARCWRYELEVKGEAAPLLAKLVDDDPDPAAYIQQFVHTYCEAHGIAPAFPPTGRQALRPGFTRRSDRARTLAWFKRSVAPSLRRVLADGPERDAYEALGLAWPPPPAETVTKS